MYGESPLETNERIGVLEQELKKLKHQVKKEEETRRQMMEVAKKRDEETKATKVELAALQSKLEEEQQSR